MSQLFDKTTQALNTSANMRQLRHAITSANIANAETPGFKAKKIDFEAALSRAVDTAGLRSMKQGHAEHFPTGGGLGLTRIAPDIYENPDGSVNNDGNTVDLEKEMVTLSENAILYKAALSLINKKIAALKYAATEGR